LERTRTLPVEAATPVASEELPMLSTLVRLSLLAGFVVVARRILAPDAPPPPRLAPPGAAGRGRKTPARKRAPA
jgi:hypothetical protein